MALEQAILGFLSDGSATGYELKTRCFDGAPRLFWTADQAQVYRTLDRLQRAGLVRSSRRRQQARPDRKVYELTDSGRSVLRTWVSTSHKASDDRDPFLMQLYLAAEVPDEALASVLSSQRDVHQQRLDEARAQIAALVADTKSASRATTLRRCALDAVAAHERSVIDWIDDCLDLLDTGGLPPIPRTKVHSRPS
jgi:DNA-binding PadR family transcriptional regulator